MSARRAMRRLIAWERYDKRCRLIGGYTTMNRYRFSDTHSLWYARAAEQGRWAPNGIRDVRVLRWHS